MKRECELAANNWNMNMLSELREALVYLDNSEQGKPIVREINTTEHSYVVDVPEHFHKVLDVLMRTETERTYVFDDENMFSITCHVLECEVAEIRRNPLAQETTFQYIFPDEIAFRRELCTAVSFFNDLVDHYGFREACESEVST